jgi:hypothetical protein
MTARVYAFFPRRYHWIRADAIHLCSLQGPSRAKSLARECANFAKQLRDRGVSEDLIEPAVAKYRNAIVAQLRDMLNEEYRPVMEMDGQGELFAS